MADNRKKDWWKQAVIYQIYPRSFQDSNGDGIGDIQGIIGRLDYLQELGVDAVWLSPVCCSPQDDNGYDISDYQDIDPMFGTLADMEELIEEAGRRNIKIILDLVLNHTSDEHRWFKEALKGKENPYHDYYIWRDGKAGILPNGLKAGFGGSAWEWVPELEQYYFHQFSVKQPDLNWENPKVRREIYDMILWWMEKGIGGFRLDVIDQIAKEPDRLITSNGPRLHEYIRELSRETFQKGCLITVGETWGADVERAKLYSSPDGSEFSMVFQFEHMGIDQQEDGEKWDMAPFSLSRFKEIMEKWQTGLYGCGWNSLFWENHDLPRSVSRWGDDGEYRRQSAKMLAILLHGMQGTPYIYQGEELAMKNVKYGEEDYRDIETLNMYKEQLAKGYNKADVMHAIHARSRDNARTPMQWSGEENAGFTEGNPWIKVNPDYTEINVRQQLADTDSVFYCYKQLIALRKQYAVFTDGRFEMLMKEDEQLFAYTRSSEKDEILVYVNFSGEEAAFTLPEKWVGAKVLICNERSKKKEVVKPYEAAILYRKK